MINGVRKDTRKDLPTEPKYRCEGCGQMYILWTGFLGTVTDDKGCGPFAHLRAFCGPCAAEKGLR